MPVAQVSRRMRSPGEDGTGAPIAPLPQCGPPRRVGWPASPVRAAQCWHRLRGEVMRRSESVFLGVGWRLYYINEIKRLTAAAPRKSSALGVLSARSSPSPLFVVMQARLFSVELKEVSR
jgi:hypothetical protein